MRPTRILHRAGNVRELLHLAAHPAVDAIEADIWVRDGRLWAHHERPVGRLLLSSRMFLRRTERVPLEDILEAVDGHSEFIIDLRSWFGDPAPDLVRALSGRLDDLAHLRVTCEAWSIADQLRDRLPALDVAYSVRSQAQLDRYLQGVDDGRLHPTPVTVRHTLLPSEAAVHALQDRAGRVGAWTIDDVERALELKAWGVDQVVSNHLTVLNAI